MGIKKPITIAIINFKGGVGKTTISYLLSKFLSNNKKILLMDLDAQVSLSSLIFKNYPEVTHSYYNQKKNKTRYLDAMKDYYDNWKKYKKPSFSSDFFTKANYLNYFIKINDNLFFLPCDESLYLTYGMFFRREVFINFLCDYFLEINGIFKSNSNQEFDYIILDCPPNFGILTFSIFHCSDFILLPYTPDFFSEKGLYLLVKTIVDSIEFLKVKGKSIKEKYCIFPFMNRAEINKRQLKNEALLTKKCLKHKKKIEDFARRMMDKYSSIHILLLNSFLLNRVAIADFISSEIQNIELPIEFSKDLNNLWKEIELVMKQCSINGL